MKLSRDTPCNHIEIKAPRWKERVVGIAKFRVGTHNSVDIMATDKEGKRYYPDTYYISGADIEKHEVQRLANGGVEVYLVPINDLSVLERV